MTSTDSRTFLSSQGICLKHIDDCEMVPELYPEGALAPDPLKSTEGTLEYIQTHTTG